MAQNINSVVITGNLTRDPELRTTNNGTSVASLRLAVNDRRKVGDDWQEVANYFSVTVWGRQGENCVEYLEKGRAVAVKGRLQWREWEDKESGKKREAVDIVADLGGVQFLGGGNGERRQEADVPADMGGFDEPSGKSGDDIPF